MIDPSALPITFPPSPYPAQGPPLSLLVNSMGGLANKLSLTGLELIP